MIPLPNLPFTVQCTLEWLPSLSHHWACFCQGYWRPLCPLDKSNGHISVVFLLDALRVDDTLFESYLSWILGYHWLLIFLLSHLSLSGSFAGFFHMLGFLRYLILTLFSFPTLYLFLKSHSHGASLVTPKNITPAQSSLLSFKYIYLTAYCTSPLNVLWVLQIQTCLMVESLSSFQMCAPLHMLPISWALQSNHLQKIENQSNSWFILLLYP